VVVAVVVAILTACSSGDGGSGDEAAGPTSTAAPFGECLVRGSNVARQTPAGDETAYLLDARVTRLDACVDEVVFEFRSPGRELPPGYEVTYEPGPTYVDFTSGDEFDMTGGAFLVIRFVNTATAEFVEVDGELEGRDTFDLGRESIAPSDLNHLQEARLVRGADGVVQWVLALDSERPFTIDASTHPVPLPAETPTSTAATTTTLPDPNAPSTTTTTRLTEEATSQIVVRIG
jgi:hypothetical protein